VVLQSQKRLIKKGFAGDISTWGGVQIIYLANLAPGLDKKVLKPIPSSRVEITLALKLAYYCKRLIPNDGKPIRPVVSTFYG
jgi:hypothetical protein